MSVIVNAAGGDRQGLHREALNKSKNSVITRQAAEQPQSGNLLDAWGITRLELQAVRRVMTAWAAAGNDRNFLTHSDLPTTQPAIWVLLWPWIAGSAVQSSLGHTNRQTESRRILVRPNKGRAHRRGRESRPDCLG